MDSHADKIRRPLDSTPVSPTMFAHFVLRTANRAPLRDWYLKVLNARQVFENFQRGRIDRSLFTANANSYFTDQAVRDFAASLGPLGKPASFVQTSQRDRGGMTFHGFDVKFSKKTLAIWERDMPDGKIEQFQIMAKD